MTHPEELLAGYVDGTLPDQERAAVDAHLPDCATCREEIALATRASGALASLPEEPVPFGVTGPVLAEARTLVERRRPAWARLQWAVGIAAAASLVLLAVIVLPRLSNDSGQGPLREPSAEKATDQAVGGAAFSAAGPGLERLDQDFANKDLAALAKRSAEAPSAPPQPTAIQSSTNAQEAVACLTSSGATIDDKDVLVRLIDARYLGTPAYLGVFQEGPGGGQPPDTMVVWVVRRSDCSILTLFSRRI